VSSCLTFFNTVDEVIVVVEEKEEEEEKGHFWLLASL